MFSAYGGTMQRRQFITLLGGAAAAWPLTARAQQSGGMRRVGVLLTGKPTDATSRSYLAAFVESLQKSGWIDGQDVRIELRWSGDEADLAGLYAAELVALAPEVILAATTDNLKALQRLTRAIPIVFTQASDPIEQGFVASLARPGGNITGFAAYEFSIGGKWLDLLKQMVPGLRRVAAMFNPETASPSQFYLRSIEAAALSFNVEVVAAPVHEPAHIQSAIDSGVRRTAA
jgi:putative tryptophan/tyrosine transport system substrate-binding protein